MNNVYINIKPKLATHYSLMFSSNMKVFLILSSFFLAAQAATSYEDIILKEWALYKAEHGKSYTNQDEDARRMEIFLENKLFVAEHNARFLRGEETYDVELNKFSDLLPEEQKLYLGIHPENKDKLKEEYIQSLANREEYVPLNKGPIPNEKNWVTAGAVTEVKDQKNCSASYAIAAAGALEGQMFIKKKQKLQSLSAQNIIDCSRMDDNSGCYGGLPQFSFSFVKYNKGLNAEKDYPYEAREGPCRYRPDRIAATCKWSESVNSEENLKEAVGTIGPVTVRLDGSQKGFQMYKSGVYSDPNCTTWFMTVSTLAVGYGVDPATKKDYWLIKNCWGSNWGDKGYIKLARNANNMCGVVSWAVYPEV